MRQEPFHFVPRLFFSLLLQFGEINEMSTGLLVASAVQAPPMPTVTAAEHTTKNITLHIGLSWGGDARFFWITANYLDGREVYLNKTVAPITNNNTQFIFDEEAEPGTCFNMRIRALSVDNTTIGGAFQLFACYAPPTPTVIATEHTTETIILHIGLSGKGNASAFWIPANYSNGTEIYRYKSVAPITNKNAQFIFHVEAKPGTCFNMRIRALSADGTTSETAFPLFACYAPLKPSVSVGIRTSQNITLKLTISGYRNVERIRITGEYSEESKKSFNQTIKTKNSNNTEFIFNATALPGTCFNLSIVALSADDTPSESAVLQPVCYAPLKPSVSVGIRTSQNITLKLTISGYRNVERIRITGEYSEESKKSFNQTIKTKNSNNTEFIFNATALPGTCFNLSIVALSADDTPSESAVLQPVCYANPVITNLTFTIRMTEMNFTDDLNNSSSVIYHSAKNKFVQTLDMLLGRLQGYSGTSLLRFRRGSVKADAKVSVNQFGNISIVQAALKQSVSSGFIGLNGTRIAVDSTYFISYIGDGYYILDGINITNAGDIYNGSSVNITCITIIVGNVTPTLTWKYNGNDINPVPDSRISISTITVEPETPQMIYKKVSFNPIQSSDSGTYECVVMDGNSSPSVMNKTVIVISQPEVFIQPVTQTVDAGSTVIITCQVGNNMSITQMVWYRNGTEINSTNQLSEEKISNRYTTNTLTRTNIQYTTRYECRGDNAAGHRNTRQAIIYVVLLGSHHGETCTNETDKRGTKWSRTLHGTYDNKSCPTGMSGEAVRYCSQGGVWRDPSYDNCINKALLELQTLTDNIKNGLAPNRIPDSLVKLTSVTNPNNVELQKAEVQVVSTILDNVIQISNNTKNITNIEVENFLEIASNVIDVKNSPSWQALINEDKEGASIILRNVEKYSSIKAKSTKSTEPVKCFTKKNLFVEIGYKPVSDIQFPNTTANGSAFKNGSSSRFVLSQDAWKNGNYTSYSGAYFNNVSGIMQKNLRHNGSIKNTEADLEINSAVLSLQLDPPPSSLSPPLALTFKHFSETYSNPNCRFWMFNADGRGNGAWSGEGCKLVSTSDDTTVCQCDHLTNFAILMSPGKTPAKDQVPLSIISIIGCAISIFCLFVTMIAHLIVWRYVKSARSSLVMNLCAALLISYVIFLTGVDRAENKNACIAVAALLHYFYLSVFFLMLAFGIEIAVSVIYVFVTRSRIRWLLPIAWILPAVVVAVSLGVTKLEGYGNKKFCWLSIEHGLIWSFVGPAALVILLNFIIIIVVFHRMFSSSAMMTKSDKIKAKTAVRSLCVLLPITGITWVFGILSVNEDLVVFQYLFAIINSLQGLFIFLFHCVLNHHLKEAIKKMNASRKRNQVPVSTNLNSSSHSSEPKTCDTLDEEQKNKASDLEASSTNSFLGSDRQMEKQVETYVKDDQLNNEYAESSTDMQNKRCGHTISMRDVKLSNNLHDSKGRRDQDNAQAATSSATRVNANTSAEIDAGNSSSFREREPKRKSTSARTRKANDITRAKKHGKANELSLHYQHSAFDMVDMGPNIYHGSSENIAG